MSEADGLVWAFKVDSGGRGTAIDWSGIDGVSKGEFCWIHIELEAAGAQAWLRESSGLTELSVDALIAEETRPRATLMEGEGLVLILRGVNLNPGADPADMVSVRLWADSNRVITIRRRRLLALEDMRERLVAGRGARNVAEFIAELASGLVDRMSGVLGDLDESLDRFEEATDGQSAGEKRGRLLELRMQAIALRRYLSPQRDALARVSTERIAWLGEPERLKLREVLDRTTRYVEDLEASRERASVTQEELANRLAEQLNQRMYALSIIAGIFLPLSFVTGLLGINVAGIPGVETPWAFGAVCASLVVLGIGEVLLFRRLGWL